MTKPLTNQQKREKKEKRKQQRATSKTVKIINQPKPADQGSQEAQPVNLCDDCAYEYGECEGKPKFASDQDKTLTGAEADRVIECPAFVNVAAMLTADQAKVEETFAEGNTFDEAVAQDGTIEITAVPAERSETDIQTQVIRTDLPERPDPKRFQTEEDFGICQSCARSLTRTAFNRYQDAIRCVNPRCRAYRAVVKTISTGVK